MNILRKTAIQEKSKKIRIQNVPSKKIYYLNGYIYESYNLELSRNVQSENTQNLGWADIMQRDERAACKFLVPQVGDRFR